MKFRKAFTFLSALVLLVSVVSVIPVGAAPVKQPGDSPFIREITTSLSTSLPSIGSRSDLAGVELPEIPKDVRATEGAGLAAGLQANTSHPKVGRSKSHEDEHNSDPLKAPRVRGSQIANENPGLFASFDGLNHRNQRLANGGNQFSLEPPDQGLCAGNGFVLESVNDVLRVFDTNGNPLTGVIDLNSFYGYPAQINRTTGEQGPFVTDPSCYYDADTQRWFHVVLTLDVDPVSGDFLGTNHVDIAVSTTPDPTKSWVAYFLPVQDDGTQGTPDHGCSFGPCIGDYPHIGADQYGFYVTTNEYSLFGPEFKSAQVYAFSKKALAANASTVTVVQFDTTASVNSKKGDQPGFTVWPAFSAAGKYNNGAGGTEFFLSSNAAEEANGVPGGDFSKEIVLWAMTNTRSLDSAHPDPHLRNHVLDSEVYGVPPKSEQKPGDFPLGQCINDTTMATPFGPGCWQILSYRRTRSRRGRIAS